MHIKPKKGLGQNFLIDKNIQRKIIAACQFKSSNTVLEIGAGRGELTRLLADTVGRLFALEIDPFLSKILQDDFKGYPNIKIINGDILKFNLRRYFSKLKNKIKIIGNIPYYITTPIIEHLLKSRDKIDTIFLTVQKEFAKRITATSSSGDYSSFSCFLQYYTNPQILFSINKTCFRPMPKVDSSFLRLEIRQKAAVITKNEKLFFQIIRSAFNKRRKTLRNSLRDRVSPEKLDKFFIKYGINRNIRPENLTLQDFANLTNI
jgi:16S rRNA (adenine1518-N6/adenine1519-N6)-dimethyltransferase